VRKPTSLTQMRTKEILSLLSDVEGRTNSFGQTTQTQQLTDETACKLRRDYLVTTYDLPKISAAVNHRPDDSIFVFEKTPAYVRTPGVASILHRLFGGREHKFKVVLLLRDPVARLYSEYRFVLSNPATLNLSFRRSFDGVVQADMELLKEANLTKAPTLEEYFQVLRQQGTASAANSFERWRSLTHASQLARVYNLYGKTEKKYNDTRNMVYNSLYSLQVREWLHYLTSARIFWWSNSRNS